MNFFFQFPGINPLDLIVEIESDSESLIELQDSLNIPRIQSKPKFLKSISLDLNNNLLKIDDCDEKNHPLNDPKYQSNLNFEGEKLIEELKTANEILNKELGKSREKVKKLELDLSFLTEKNKNLENNLLKRAEKEKNHEIDIKELNDMLEK